MQVALLNDIFIFWPHFHRDFLGFFCDGHKWSLLIGHTESKVTFIMSRFKVKHLNCLHELYFTATAAPAAL